MLTFSDVLGTGFPLSERKEFGLTGRLPYRVNTLDEQCHRAYDQLKTRDTPIRKNTFLQVSFHQRSRMISVSTLTELERPELGLVLLLDPTASEGAHPHHLHPDPRRCDCQLFPFVQTK